MNLSILNHFNKDFSSGLIDRNVFDFKLFQIRKKGREKRRLEQRWCASRSMCDREAYTRQCKVVKDLLSSSRSNYYSNLVAENQSNMRSLFAGFSTLLHRRHEAKWLMILFNSLVTEDQKNPS